MTTPDPALVERARNVAEAWCNERGEHGRELAMSLTMVIAAFAAEESQGQLAATERATVTAGKWRRAYEDAYSKLQTTEARAARLREALVAWKVRLSFVGQPHESRQPDGTPDWSGVVKLTDAALAEPAG